MTIKKTAFFFINELKNNLLRNLNNIIISLKLDFRIFNHIKKII
jgi:hypothetical protein